MILTNWFENFHEEFKTESCEFFDESEISSDYSDLFSSDQSEIISSNSDSKRERTSEDNIFENDEEEPMYNKPNIFKWDAKRLAHQITLILSIQTKKKIL